MITMTKPRTDRVRVKSRAATTSDAEIPTTFGRLVQIMQENDALYAALAPLNDRLMRAWVYAAAPGSNALLADALVRQARAKHAEVVVLIRRNRAEALGILGAVDPDNVGADSRN